MIAALSTTQSDGVKYLESELQRAIDNGDLPEVQTLSVLILKLQKTMREEAEKAGKLITVSQAKELLASDLDLTIEVIWEIAPNAAPAIVRGIADAILARGE